MQMPNCAQYMQAKEDTDFHHIHVPKKQRKRSFYGSCVCGCDIQAVVIDRPSQISWLLYGFDKHILECWCFLLMQLRTDEDETDWQWVILVLTPETSRHLCLLQFHTHAVRHLSHCMQVSSQLKAASSQRNLY